MTGIEGISPIAPDHFQFAGRKVTFVLNGFQCYIVRAGTKGAYQGLARNLDLGVGLQTDRVFGEGAKIRVTEAVKAAVRNVNQTPTTEGNAI